MLERNTMRVKMVAVLSILFCAVLACGAAWAQDVYNEKNETVIEKVTEGDIPKLVQLLGDPDPRVRSLSMTFLRSFGTKAVPELLDALRKGANTVTVMDILGETNDPRAAEPIAAYIGGKGEEINAALKRNLEALGDLSVPALVRRLEDKENRSDVEAMLCDIRGSVTSGKLVRPMLSSPDGGLRAAAVRILGAWGYMSADDAFRMLDDKYGDVRGNAIYVYGRVTNEYDQRKLADLLKDENPKVRSEAAKLLGRVLDPDMSVVAKPLIDAAKNDTDNNARKQALYALGALKVPGALLPLLDALNAKDADVQVHALGGLTQLKAREAVPYLLKPYEEGKDVKEMVTAGTCDVLQAIGDPVDIMPFLPYLTRVTAYDDEVLLIDLIKAFTTDANRKSAEDALEKFIRQTDTCNYRDRATDALNFLKNK